MRENDDHEEPIQTQETPTENASQQDVGTEHDAQENNDAPEIETTREIPTAISEEERREDERIEDDEHEEDKAPKGFLPPLLLIILTMGVLSTECEGALDYVGSSTVRDEHRVKAPSRAEIREENLSDATSSLSSTPYKDPIARLKEHASFNEAYARVQDTKNEIAKTKLEMEREMVGMKKKEIDAHSREVTAREKEVKEAHLHSLYVDFRDDLKFALEINDVEEAARIREEMKRVKRRRLDLYSRTQDEVNQDHD